MSQRTKHSLNNLYQTNFETCPFLIRIILTLSLSIRYENQCRSATRIIREWLPYFASAHIDTYFLSFESRQQYCHRLATDTYIVRISARHGENNEVTNSSQWWKWYSRKWGGLNVGGGEVQSETGNDIVAYCCTCCSRALNYLDDHDATIVADDDGDTAQPFRRQTLLGGRPARAGEGLRGRESGGAATALIASLLQPLTFHLSARMRGWRWHWRQSGDRCHRRRRSGRTAA